MSRRVVTIAFVASALTLAAPVRAQSWHHYQSHASEQSMSYVLGFAALDDGVATDSLGRAWSVRMDAPILGRFVVGEVALSGISEKDTRGARQRFLIPEAQLQFQLPVGPFRPYIGFGGGGVMGPSDGSTILSGGKTAASTAIGLRTYLSGDRITLNIESRARQYGPRQDRVTSVDVTAGMGIRF